MLVILVVQSVLSVSLSCTVGMKNHFFATVFVLKNIHSFYMSSLYFQKRTKSQTVLIFAKSAKECQRFQHEHFSLQSPKARLFIRINIIALYCC